MSCLFIVLVIFLFAFECRMCDPVVHVYCVFFLLSTLLYLNVHVAILHSSPQCRSYLVMVFFLHCCLYGLVLMPCIFYVLACQMTSSV